MVDLVRLATRQAIHVWFPSDSGDAHLKAQTDVMHDAAMKYEDAPQPGSPKRRVPACARARFSACSWLIAVNGQVQTKFIGLRVSGHPPVAKQFVPWSNDAIDDPEAKVPQLSEGNLQKPFGAQ